MSKKSKPAAKSKQDQPVETKITEAPAPVVEPTVTTVADTPVAASAADETPEAKPASKAVVEQHGIRQPGEGTLCAKVWAALDVLRAEGKDATFEAVRELAGSGMADATIRTQRQRWREFTGIKGEEKKVERKPKAAAPAVASEEPQQQSA